MIFHFSLLFALLAAHRNKMQIFYIHTIYLSTVRTYTHTFIRIATANSTPQVSSNTPPNPPRSPPPKIFTNKGQYNQPQRPVELIQRLFPLPLCCKERLTVLYIRVVFAYIAVDVDVVVVVVVMISFLLSCCCDVS